jgi:hypothetical protein
MRQFIFAVTLALGAATASGTAEAGIPLPCTGEKIIKVADIPRMEAMGGAKMDLGYKFSWCFSGEWIGHIGSDSRYMPLDPQMLSILTEAGLVPKLPEPGFWASAVAYPGKFWVEWLWLVIGGFSVSPGRMTRAMSPAGASPSFGKR